MGKVTTVREIAHSGIAILGAIAASGALVLGFLGSIGVHGLDVQVTEFAGACGALAVLLSKLIDSANDAITSASSTSGK